MSHRRHPPVPTTSQVIPGANVNIVLKADQRTGRTVQGVVRDVLTRGNHPRGIKVRLADGRVGRVQTMAAGATSSSAPQSVGGPRPSGTGSPVGAVQDTSSVGDLEQGPPYDDHGYGPGGRPGRGGRRGGRGGNVSRGFDDEPGLPSREIGLDAYVKEGKPKRPGKGKGKTFAAGADDDDDDDEDQAAGSQAPPEVVTCPVCGTFEGDETAVAHHVAAHFDTGS